MRDAAVPAVADRARGRRECAGTRSATAPSCWRARAATPPSCAPRWPPAPTWQSTNRYGGTALIPACHYGHVETVRLLLGTAIDVDHVNNLGWTALLEAVILGDGGPGPYRDRAPAARRRAN
jgi:hypothetical protein